MIRDLIENGTPSDILTTVLAVMIIVAMFLTFFYLIWGGIQFIISAGDEEKAKAAQGTIRSCIIGLFVCFIAFFIVRLITGLFDIPFELTYASITDTMSEILTSLQ